MFDMEEMTAEVGGCSSFGGTRVESACPLYPKRRERVIRLVSLLRLVSDINQNVERLRFQSGLEPPMLSFARLFLHLLCLPHSRPKDDHSSSFEGRRRSPHLACTVCK